MANFPSGIRCSTITPTAGAYPGNRVASISGNEASFQGGNRMTGAKLSIEFEQKTPAEIASIRTHWDGEGLTDSWLLSEELMDGLEEYAAEYGSILWRYAVAPQITEITSEAGGVHDVSIELAQAPMPAFIDTLLLNAQPATVGIGGMVRLLGPDTLPDLWISRLTTATRTPHSNGGGIGSIIYGTNGENFQAFWFEEVGGSGVRVAVVKRDIRGAVLWIVYTSAEFGSTTTSFLSYAPQVVASSDGGCVVFAIESGTLPFSSSVLTMRGWRLGSNGTEIWRKDYTGNTLGAYRVAINGSEVVVYSASFHPDSGRISPALYRINLANGNYIGGSVYRIDNATGGISPGRRDNMFVLSSGAIALKIAQTIFMEVSNTGSSVNKCAGFTVTTGSCLDGPAAQMGTGYVCRNDATTLVHLDSEFNITARYRHENTMLASGEFLGFFGLGIAAFPSGVGYAVSYNFASGDFLGLGVKIAKFANNGANLVGYGEIAHGSGIGSFQSADVDKNSIYGMDISLGRGLLHIPGQGASSSCRINAIGFALDLPPSTAANTTPAGTLDTGTCSNTMSIRGWNSVTYTSGTPNDITKSTLPVNVASFSLTVTTGSLSMIDASGVLTWNRSILYV
jgi:hypothetical protein